MIAFLDGRVTLFVGDCLTVLAGMEPDSVDCVVTSPPYWGLRDYGIDGQLGLEPTLAEHLLNMVEVFRAIRRVLKPTGTCWVNYGDCYATSPNGRSAADTKATGNDDRTFRDKPFSTVGPIKKPHGKRVTAGTEREDTSVGGWGKNDHSVRWRGGGFLKPKDLCMVPNRLAIALQDDGWWVRSEIIWAKPNPMPESIKDRPATSHEKIFMLTKSARYYYDAESVRQKATKTGTPGHLSSGKNSREHVRRTPNAQDKIKSPHVQGFTRRATEGKKWKPTKPGRNLRNYEPAPVNVWNIATLPFSEAHFATFPPALAERCILAGCPKGGVVLDPFGGAGTTALIALRHNRLAQLIELNPEYAEIAQRRIESEWRVQPRKTGTDLGPLFEGGAI